MEPTSYKHSELTEEIIRVFYKVYNKLGYGFLEKVYENAMALELKRAGFQVSRQQPIDVYYDEAKIGSYFTDLVVDEIVIIELKAAKSLCEEHEAQLINYLKATEIEVGLLFNFGKVPELKRKVFSNEFK
jgi:GxxExxY protein